MQSNLKKSVGAILLIICSGVAWRIGGKGGFDNAKLVRRLGVPIICLIIAIMYNPFIWWKYLISLVCLVWASSSYFGWINKLLKEDCGYCSLGANKSYAYYPRYKCIFCIEKKVGFCAFLAECKIESEFWWNFLAESIVFQSSILPFRYSLLNIGILIIFSCLGAFGKFFIDRLNIKHQDIYSEFYFGFIMSLGIFINCLVV